MVRKVHIASVRATVSDLDILIIDEASPRVHGV